MSNATPPTRNRRAPVGVDHKLVIDFTKVPGPTETQARQAGRTLVRMALDATGRKAPDARLDDPTRNALIDVLQMVGLKPCPEIEHRGTHGTLLRFDSGCLCPRCAEADMSRTARTSTTHEEARP